MSLNTNFNHTHPSNGTDCACDIPQNLVAWQSVFWPIVACTVAVMLQETGRVYNAPHRYSYALRSSPIVCAADTFLMLLKFLCMLAVGCSFKVAARHVWYDRFMKEWFLSPKAPWLAMGSTSFPTGPFTTFSIGTNNERPPTSTTVLNTSADDNNNNDIYMCSGALPVEIQGDTTSDDTATIPLDAIVTVAPTTISTPTHSSDMYMCSGALPVEVQDHIPSDDVATVPLDTIITVAPPTISTSTESSDMFMCSGALPVAQTSSEHTASIPVETLEGQDIGDVQFTELSTVEVHEHNDVEAGIQAPLVAEASPMELAKYYDGLPGSTVDRTWRISMASFLLGALPQAVKVFGLKGVPKTQAFVAVLIVSFLIPEFFRLLAGPAGKVNLHPMPIVLNAKLHLLRLTSVSYSIVVPGVFLTWSFAAVIITNRATTTYSIPTGLTLACVGTFGCCLIADFLSKFRIYTTAMNTLKPSERVVKMLTSIRSQFVLLLCNYFPFQASAVQKWTPLGLIFLFNYAIAMPLAFLIGDHIMKYSEEGVSIGLFLLYALTQTSAGMFTIPHLVFISYVIFCLLFKGKLSPYVRHLSGLGGSTGGFLVGGFAFGNLLCLCSVFPVCWTTENTYKPGWAENLG